MNETLKTLTGRRSVRSFLPDAVPEDVLREVLEAGMYAPTGMNYQNPIIIAITNRDVIRELSRLNARIMQNEKIDPFYGAPVVLLVACKKWPCAVYDGSCVMMNLLNAAESVGLGSCWVHRAKEELETDFGKALLRNAGVENPEDYEGIGHVVLGYPDGPKPAKKPRKDNYVYWVK